MLAEMAEMSDDIDVERARVALARAESEEGPEAKAAQERALARLRAVEAEVGTTASH